MCTERRKLSDEDAELIEALKKAAEAIAKRQARPPVLRDDPAQPVPTAPEGGFPKPKGPLDPWAPIYPKGPLRPDTPKDQPVIIPPSTPPIGPYAMVYDPERGGYFEVTNYVNGWCAILWIVRTDPDHGGSSLDDQPASGKLMSEPSQAAVNKLAIMMQFANYILWKCETAVRV